MAQITLTFDFNWKLTLSVIFVFPALIRLSFWQIERAEEKKLLTHAWTVQQEAPAVSFSAHTPYEDFQRVTLQGRFLTGHYWLKENQLYRRQLGYHVIMPFQLKDTDLIIIVNRGWVKGAPRRDFTPEVFTPPGIVRLSGTLLYPSDSKFIQETQQVVNVWPHKILEVDLDMMAGQIDKALYNKILRVDVDDPSALAAHWQPVNNSPAKHYGYAVQWALMAAALMILYIFASTNLSEWIKVRVK